MKTVSVVDKKKLANESGLESVGLSIDTAGLVHLMSVLTNLYSEPRHAVLREYVSNAIDSHVKAGGVDRPIEVTLPVTHSDEFMLTVRDYGVGMSKEEIVNVYSRYGNSTKRDNNDEIGGFGLGAKSALAIADRFDVVSIKDGVRVEFYIEKNAQGAGVVYFVSEKATKEPSGVEVRIPYDRPFEGMDWVREFFVGLPSGTLNVNGELLVNTLDNEDVYHTVAGMTPDFATGWYSKATTYSGGEVRAVVGGVVYTVKSGHFDRTIFYNLSRFNHEVYLNLPIGSVDLTPSREDLMYTEKTVKVITTTLSELYAAIEARMQSELNAVESIQDAFEFVRTAADAFWGASKLTWRGEKVPLTHSFNGNATVVSLRAWDTKSSLERLSLNGNRSIHEFFHKQSNLIVFADGNLDQDAVTIRRHMRIFRDNLNALSVILISDKKDWDNKWIALGRHEKFVTASELIAYGKEVMKAERKATREANAAVGRVTRPVATVATFKRVPKDFVFGVEKVFAGDKRLATDSSKVLYVKQNTHRAVWPYLYNDGDEIEWVKDTGNGFWTILRENFKNYTIFMLSSQKSLDKFIAEYPNAVSAEKVVREYARKNFTPTRNVNFSQVVRNISYDLKSVMNTVDALVNALKEVDRLSEVENPVFTRISNLRDEYTIKEISKEESQLARWAGYTEASDEELTQLVLAESNAVVEQLKQLRPLRGVSLGGLTDKQVTQVISFINLLTD